MIEIRELADKGLKTDFKNLINRYKDVKIWKKKSVIWSLDYCNYSTTYQKWNMLALQIRYHYSVYSHSPIKTSLWFFITFKRKPKLQAIISQRMLQIRSQQIFSVKDQIVKVFGFASHMVSVATTQLCSHRVKVTINKMQTNRHG